MKKIMILITTVLIIFTIASSQKKQYKCNEDICQSPTCERVTEHDEDWKPFYERFMNMLPFRDDVEEEVSSCSVVERVGNKSRMICVDYKTGDVDDE